MEMVDLDKSISRAHELSIEDRLLISCFDMFQDWLADRLLIKASCIS